MAGLIRAENWPGWRGPSGDGVSAGEGIPTKWSSTENIAWKIAVPGEGHSSPIVWGDKVFLTSSLTEKNKRILLCIDRLSGQTVWQRDVVQSPPETIHRLNSRASGTPATDGKQVYVTFMRAEGDEVIAPNVGSERLITPGKIIVAAYDLDGNEKWKTNVGDFVSAHGFNTCPVLFEDLLILNGDHDGDAYLVALDRQSGRQRWRTRRENKTRSYVTPIIREIDGITQMILSGSLCIASYDPRNGKRHWIVDGPTEQFVASMVYDGKYVFATGGYPERHTLAIRPGGKGNVTDTHIAWRTTRGAAYVPSPIISGRYLLMVADSGIASCFEARTGKRHWMERLPGGHSPSPVSADGLVYFVSDRGVTTIIRPSETFAVIAKNELGEPVSASPAISQGQIFLRTHQHLYCIGSKKN
ncbi:MAG: PQQ-binding-like beta-propeller repeat protein [Verrucomicrobiota bacterium]|nr:PQQ-binding-like beta-propeller repeat protein [Verrucomicrobiota bacterium]